MIPMKTSYAYIVSHSGQKTFAIKWFWFFLFIFFLNSSEIQGSLLSYSIVLVGILFEIDICKLSLNIFHILSISCESCDWFILWYVVFRSCFMLSQLAFEYFSICLGLCLHRRRETVISRDKMSWSASPMGGIVSKLSTIIGLFVMIRSRVLALPCPRFLLEPTYA